MSSVDPVHYGALPGGTAAANTAAIQAALDTGKNVRFGTPGSYDINDRLDQTTNGQKVDGNGAELIQTLDKNGWQMGTEGIRETQMGLRDLIIRYDGPLPSSSTGLVVVEATHTRIDNVTCNATGASGWAIGLEFRSLFSGTHYNQVVGGGFIGCRVNSIVLKPNFGAPFTGSANENSFYGVRLSTVAGGDAAIFFHYAGANPDPACNDCTFVACAIEGAATYAVQLDGGSANRFINMRMEGTWGTSGVLFGAPTRACSWESMWNSSSPEVTDNGEKNMVDTPFQQWRSVLGSPVLTVAGLSPYRFVRRDGNDNSNRTSVFRFEDNDTEHSTTNTGPSQMLDLEAEFNTHADAYFIKGASLAGPTDLFKVTGLGQGRFAAGVAYAVDGTGPVDLAGAGTPEGAVTAPIGSLYRRSDGGVTTALSVKESGVGNTGWEGVATRSYVDAPGITAFAGASATFAAGGVRVCTVDADATNITDFTGGVAGQELIVIATGNRTIVHGAPIALDGSANRAMVSGSTMHLVNDGSKWFEVPRTP